MWGRTVAVEKPDRVLRWAPRTCHREGRGGEGGGWVVREGEVEC